MKIYWGNLQIGDHARSFMTSGFTISVVPSVQISQPVRSEGIVPYSRKNRGYSVGFTTTWLFDSVGAAESFLSSHLVELALNQRLSWLTTPPGGASTWYLWKSKLLRAAPAGPYLGCTVAMNYEFIGSHLANSPDPEPILS